MQTFCRCHLAISCHNSIILLKRTLSYFEGSQNLFQNSYRVSEWKQTCAVHSKNWFTDHTLNGEDFWVMTLKPYILQAGYMTLPSMKGLRKVAVDFWSRVCGLFWHQNNAVSHFKIMCINVYFLWLRFNYFLLGFKPNVSDIILTGSRSDIFYIFRDTMYTTLKSHLWFTLRRVTVMRISK